MSPERGQLIEWLAKHPQVMQSARKHWPKDPEEAVQRALVIAMEKLPAHITDRTQALKWVRTVVKREAWSLWRMSLRTGNLEAMVDEDGDEFWQELFTSDAPEPSERVVRNEQRDERIRAMAELKYDERVVLFLLGLGYSYRDMMEATGWTYTKINRCVAEGRNALRDRGVLAVA